MTWKTSGLIKKLVNKGVVFNSSPNVAAFINMALTENKGWTYDAQASSFALSPLETHTFSHSGNVVIVYAKTPKLSFTTICTPNLVFYTTEGTKSAYNLAYGDDLIVATGKDTRLATASITRKLVIANVRIPSVIATSLNNQVIGREPSGPMCGYGD